MARLGRFAFVLSLALALTPHAAAQGSEERAEELFRAGNSAFAASDYREAYTYYREAWSLKKSFDIACNLGRTEAELGLSRDAAEHLDYCLRTFSVSSRTEVKDANRRFRELFARVRAEVGALSVEAHPDGAAIAVDGAEYGLAPLERELFVDPGEHRVRARLSGYTEQEVVVRVEAGGSAPVRLSLTQAPPAVPLAVASGAATETTKASDTKRASAASGIHPRTVVVLAGGGLTLVALGVGVAFLVQASSANDRASQLGESIATSGPPGGCAAAAPPPECAALEDAIDEEDRSRDVAAVALTAGAITSAVTLGTWLIWPDRSPAPASGFHVTPTFSARMSGLVVSGQY